MLIPMLTTVLLQAPVPLADPEEALVAARFDLSDLRTVTTAEFDAVSVYPFPHEDHDSVHHGDEVELDLEGLVSELLYDVVAPDEFEYEGRHFDMGGDDVLHVVAPEGVVERVGGFVDYLRAAFVRDVQLSLAVHELEPVEGGGQPVAGDAVFLQTVSLPLDRTVALGNLVRTTYLSGWESEIAQMSTASDPEMREVLTGLEMLVRVEEAQGGSFRVRHAARVAGHLELEERGGPGESRVALDGQVWQTRQSGFQVPSLATAYSAGSRQLMPRQATTQDLWMETEAGWRGWRFSTTLLSVEAEPPAFLVGERAVRLMPHSAFTTRAPLFDPVRPEAVGVTDDWLVDFFRLDEPQHAHVLSEYDVDDSVSRALEPLWDEGHAMGSFELGPALALWGEADVVERAAAGLAALQPAPRPVDLELSLRAGDEVLSQGVLSLGTGDAGMLGMGDSRTFVADAEVDVANAAAIRQARTRDLIDGLLVRVQCGDTSLHVQGQAVRLLDVQRTPDDHFDLPSYAHASLDQRLPLDGREYALGVLGEATLWARAVVR